MVICLTQTYLQQLFTAQMLHTFSFRRHHVTLFLTLIKPGDSDSMLTCLTLLPSGCRRCRTNMVYTVSVHAECGSLSHTWANK